MERGLSGHRFDGWCESFVVIGEAGMIAGNLVTVSFLTCGIIALLCGYSFSKPAICYPSRGGETDGNGWWILAAVADSFGAVGFATVYTLNLMSFIMFRAYFFWRLFLSSCYACSATGK